MRLSCPKCQIEYEVPDAALTGRSRTLRCSNCMTKWKAPALEMYRTEPETPEASEPVFPALPDVLPVSPEVFPQTEPVLNPDETIVTEAPADEIMAREETAIEEAPKPERVSLLKVSREAPVAAEPEPSRKRGLKISALLVLLIIVAVLAEHRAIGNLWPPSLRLFNALGLR